jgi:hypothetical protein
MYEAFVSGEMGRLEEALELLSDEGSDEDI